MRYQLYKPNSKNTGCAASFNVGRNRDGSPCLFINTVQQSGWNDQTKTGSFKENAKNPQKSATVKMNANEAGEMISSIQSRTPVVFFHKNNEDTTIITFSPWDKDRKVKLQGGESTFKSLAWGLSISKNSSTHYKVAFEAGESEVFKVLLVDFIQQCLFHEANKYQGNEDSSASGGNELLGGNSSSQTPENEPAEEDEDSVPF